MREERLYNIICVAENRISVRFNPDSEVFAAHFPGQPIVPGSCLVEAARHLAEVLFGKRLAVRKLKNVKFVNIINPLVVGECVCEFVEGKSSQEWNVAVKAGETTFAKMTIEFAYEQ